MDAGFIQYLRETKGFRPGDTIRTKQQYDAMYKQYLKDTSEGSNYKPEIVNVALPGTTNSVPAFMSSANSATLMKDAAPKVVYKPDAEGNLYAIEGTSAAVVTNNQGKPIKVDPKANRLEDLMAVMGGGAEASAQQDPGFFGRIFGGVQASPTPAPTPEATPAPTATPSAAMAAGQTNAPVQLRSPEEVRAAYQQGLLSKDEAKRMLMGGR